jgi:hypothetical protein
MDDHFVVQWAIGRGDQGVAMRSLSKLKRRGQTISMSGAQTELIAQTVRTKMLQKGQVSIILNEETQTLFCQLVLQLRFRLGEN